MFAKRRPSLLSVVVPAYDVAAYLPACLDSVLAQAETLGQTGLEVVVVDDGSPDESGEIAESYAARDSAGARRAHREPRARRGAQRGAPPRDRRPARLRRLRRRGAAGVLRDAAASADPHRLGLRGRLGGPLGARPGGRVPGRAALDEAAAPAADGPRHRRPAGDPGRRVRVEQAVPHRLLALDRARRGPRASATRTSRPPRWPTCAPGGSGSSPRSSTTGGSARTAPRSPSSAPRRRTCATAGRPS